MHVGILGSGLMGAKLGTLFARAGHEVVFSYSRSHNKLERVAREAGRRARAGTPEDAVREADALLLAVHWRRLDDILKQAGNLAGKVIITCSLPMNADDSALVIGLTSSGAEELAKRIRRAKIVSAFGTVPSEVFFSVYDARRKAKRPSMAYCGDDDTAKELRRGTSFMSTRPGTASGPPELVRGVDDLTKPVGTRDAVVPRGYLFAADLAAVAAKLRAHNIRVTAIDKPMTVEGEAFAIERMRTFRSAGYDMTALDGSFSPIETREFPAGSFYVDMAQPMANAAFYYLEPQARDGFVGWHVLDEALRARTAGGRHAEYPIFKMRRIVN